MPHHSKQQRAPVGGSFSPHSSTGSSAGRQPSPFYRRNIMPPPPISASMSIPPSSSNLRPPAPPGGIQQHAWMASSQFPLSYQPHQQHSLQQPGIYRAPVTPLKEDESSKIVRLQHSNSASSSSREGSPPMIMEVHQRSKSFDSQHEIAASVLLLASSARESERLAKTSSKGSEDGEESDDNGLDQTSHSSRPLKKRKKVTDIMRKSEEHHFHVSPMSGKSSLGGEEGGTRTNTPSSSYDTREEKKKISTQKKEQDSADAVFPVILHTVLADEEFADNVVWWLPDGKAWKIVRWDALRRQVLPKYFPLLNSIDSFLFQLQAWGFEEVTNGPDAGAYSHMFFRRGHPDLCSQMTCKNIEQEESLGSAPEASHYPVSRGEHSRSILRVPSLASTSCSLETSRTGNLDGGSSGKADYSSISTSSPSGNRTHYSAWSGGRVGTSGPTFVNYRPEEMSFADQQQHLHWNYSYPNTSKAVNWMRSSSNNPPSPPSNGSVVMRGMPPYSPIRIRSGRGAHRLAVTSSRLSHSSSMDASASSSHVSTPPARAFPVSNRGKGSRSLAPPTLHRSHDQSSIDNLLMLKQPQMDIIERTVNEGDDIEQNEVPGESEDLSDPKARLKRKLPIARSSPVEEKKIEETN